MTDNEIIKALECCIKAKYHEDCEEMKCPACTKEGCLYIVRADGWNDGSVEHYKDVLDIINRQKAEIERLQAEKNEWKSSAIKCADQRDETERKYGNLIFSSMVGKVRAEAIKEFAERLKNELELEDAETWFEIYECGLIREIDNLVKEMTEDQK